MILTDEKKQEYIDFLSKNYTEEGNKLIPFSSTYLEQYSDTAIYIPSSDILFLKELLTNEEKARIVAYNIEFGIWTYSKKVNISDLPKYERDLQIDSFILNIQFMLEKIEYAIQKREYNSIFSEGEDFKTTLRGINTNIQQHLQLQNFINKAKNLPNSCDEDTNNFLKNILKQVQERFLKDFKERESDNNRKAS